MVWVLTPLSLVWTLTPVLPVLLLPTGLTWTWSLLVAPGLPMNRSVRVGFDGCSGDRLHGLVQRIAAAGNEVGVARVGVGAWYDRPPGRCGWPPTGTCRAGPPARWHSRVPSPSVRSCSSIDDELHGADRHGCRCRAAGVGHRSRIGDWLPVDGGVGRGSDGGGRGGGGDRKARYGASVAVVARRRKYSNGDIVAGVAGRTGKRLGSVRVTQIGLTDD